MRFIDGITVAYETKWSFINSFHVTFNFNEKMRGKMNWTGEDDENINLHIVSMDTPQFTNSPIEQFVANKWLIHNGRDELYRFSITFRDKNSMMYYRKFLRLYQETREDYFDHVSFSVLLNKETDWKGVGDSKLFDLSGVIIESISQLQFNNTTENQIAEFTVGFKSTFPIIN